MRECPASYGTNVQYASNCWKVNALNKRISKGAKREKEQIHVLVACCSGPLSGSEIEGQTLLT